MKRMRALTLWQPWATLVAIQAKTIETRSWETQYRGPLAIHAAKRASVVLEGEARSALYDALREEQILISDLPRGAIVATCELFDCYPVEDLWPELQTLENEQLFGNFGEGRFAWELVNIRRIDPPLQASGRQGLWWVTGDKAQQLRILSYP